MTEPLSIDVKCCAQCQKDHPVTFYYAPEKSEHEGFPWVGTCENTGGPVHMRLEEV